MWNGEEEAKKNIVNRKQIKTIETNTLTILIYRKELNSHNKRQIIRLDLKNSSVCCLEDTPKRNHIKNVNKRMEKIYTMLILSKRKQGR